MRIEISENDPYTVTGGVPLVDHILIPDVEGYSTGFYTGTRYQVNEE